MKKIIETFPYLLIVVGIVVLANLGYKKYHQSLESPTIASRQQATPVESQSNSSLKNSTADAQSRLEKSGIPISENSLFKAIETNDLQAVKDIFSVLDKKSLGSVIKEIEDPRIKISKKFGIDEAYFPSFLTTRAQAEDKIKQASLFFNRACDLGQTQACKEVQH